jgi:hypothetical protein
LLGPQVKENGLDHHSYKLANPNSKSCHPSSIYHIYCGLKGRQLYRLKSQEASKAKVVKEIEDFRDSETIFQMLSFSPLLTIAHHNQSHDFNRKKLSSLPINPNKIFVNTKA